MIDRDVAAFYAIAPLYGITTFYFGNWFSAIATVKSNRDISNGVLGDYLALAALGAVICMGIAPYVLDELGSRYTVLVGYVVMGVGFTVLGVDSYNPVFALGMIIYGFGSILIYASMVAQGAVLEKSAKQLWMGMFTSMSGIGGLAGGLIGGYTFEYTNLSVWQEMLVASVAMCGLVLICIPWLYSQKEEHSALVNDSAHTSSSANIFALCGCSFDLILLSSPEETSPILQASNNEMPDSSPESETVAPSTPASPPRKVDPLDWHGLSLLCLIAGLSFFIEGSIGDWGSIYLQENWDCGSLVGIFGYVVEKLMIVISSLSCDYICTYWFSRYLVMQVSIIITMFGFSLSVVSYFMPATTTSLVLAIIGFGIAGMGMGLTVPIWFSLAGKGVRGFTITQTVAFVSTIAMVGSLVEPLALGNFADGLGNFAYSFLLEVGLLGVMMVLCAWLPRSYYDLPKDHVTAVPANAASTAEI